MTLSENEAKFIIEDMLPTIRKGIEMYGKTNMRISDIGKKYAAVEREGNTPNVFCKLTAAASEFGLSTDLGMTKNLEMTISFMPVKKPSIQWCEKTWNKIKNQIEEMQRK